jgi:hypothetical protein
MKRPGMSASVKIRLFTENPAPSSLPPAYTTRHAFAYVFAGSGKFCNASGPLACEKVIVGCTDGISGVVALDGFVGS